MVRENNGFMQEQGNPFPGGLAIFRVAATQLVMAIHVADQFGFAPTGDPFAPPAAEIFEEVSYVHAASMREGVGQIRG